MRVHIPDDLAEQLERKAAEAGTDPNQVAVEAIKRTLALDERFERLRAPVVKAFEESGMSDDDLAELLEAEKHAMRRGA